MANRSLKKSRSKTKSVQFDLYAPEAQKVSLAGDFNSWDVSALLLKRDKQGTWKATVNLEPGRYEYRFCVDDAWQDDPKAQERVDNSFGSQNCVKIVRSRESPLL